MGLFGRRRNINSDAAAIVLEGGSRPAAINRPQSVTYDNRTSYWPVVLAIPIMTILLPWLIWRMGIRVFEATGMYPREAEAAMGNVVIGLFVIAIVIAVVAALAKLFLNDYFAHSERMAELNLEALQKTLESDRYRQITAQTQPAVTNSRATDEKKRWCQLVTAVMFKAYDYYATSGKYNGVARPWSRRNALAIPLRDGTTPTEVEAGKVRGWLEERGIVKDDQININRFPDLTSIEELLNREYNIPIQIMTNGPALLRGNEGYIHIEK